MKKSLIACSALALALVACAGFQSKVAVVSADLAKACAGATAVNAEAQAVLKGGAKDTAASIGTYAVAGCATADGLAKLAADPTSTDWVNGLAAGIKAIEAQAAAPTKS